MSEVADSSVTSINQSAKCSVGPREPTPQLSLRRTIVGAGVVRMAGMIATFGVGVQLARYLGPKGVGVYGTVLSAVAVASVIAQLGLPQLLTREIAVHAFGGDVGRAKGALKYYSFAILISSTLSVLIGFTLLSVLSDTETVFVTAYYWGLPLIPLMALMNLAVNGLRGVGQEWVAQLFDALLRPVIFGSALFALFQLHPNLNAIAAVQIQSVVAVVALLIATGVLLRYLPLAVREARATRHYTQWWRSATPMAATEVLRIVDGNYPILLIGAIAPTTDVGVLRIALAMAAMIGVVSSLINVAIMPRAAAFFAAGKRDELQTLASTSAAVTFGVACVSTAGVLIVGRPTISFVFGAAFLPAWPILLTFCVAYCINGFLGSTASILNMCGEEQVVTRAYFVGLILAVLVTYGLYNFVGILSVGCGLVLSEIVKGTLLWISASRQLRIDTSALALIVRR
jgi:O-antigen/teichoic acid export membrane protein